MYRALLLCLNWASSLTWGLSHPQLLEYDLGDATKWEFFFPNVEKPLLVVPGEEGKERGMGMEEEEEVRAADIVCSLFVKLAPICAYFQLTPYNHCSCQSSFDIVNWFITGGRGRFEGRL